MKLFHDFRYALRLLAKNPGFSAICILVIVLGMTVSLVAFTLVYQFRYQDPPFPHGDRFAVLEAFEIDSEREQRRGFNDYIFARIRESVAGFEEMGAFRPTTAVFSDGDTAQLFVGVETTVELLRITHATPLLGRLLQADDYQIGAEPVVVISDAVWKAYYAGDPDVIGRQSRINGRPHTIVGVMPNGVKFPNFGQDAWLPLQISAAAQPDESGSLTVLGIIRDWREKAAVEQEINDIVSRLHQDYPNTQFDFRVEVNGYVSLLTSGTGGMGDMLLGIAVVILLLGSVNLATLLLVRANSRQQELALRRAVGSNPWQLGAQVLIESLLLCVAGALIALLATYIVLNFLRALFATAAGELFAGIAEQLVFDSATAVAGVCVMAAIWLIVGGLTAYKIIRKDFQVLLGGGNKGSRQSMAASKAVIGVEVILSVLLVSLCGMFALAIGSAYRADYGVSVENRYVGAFTLDTADYADATARNTFLGNYLREVKAMPGVVDASFTTTLPGQNGLPLTYALADRDTRQNGRHPTQGVAWVGGDYFQLLDVEIQAGRSFDSTEDFSGGNVVIVDELFAKAMWPDESAIGKQVQIDPENNGEWLSVIGVTSHIVQDQPIGWGLITTTLYRPLATSMAREYGVVVKTTSAVPLANVRDWLSQSAARVDRDIPIVNVTTLARATEQSLNVLGPMGQVFAGIALVTLLLAVLGIFGVVYRSVVSRSLEIGIRRALGSSSRDIVGIFLKQGAMYLLLGAVFGGGLAALGSRNLATLFPDLLKYLPVVLGSVLAAVGLLILVASYLPARKVVAMEAGDALRVE